MITLYTHSGPNPLKVAILLEELAVPHRREEVDVWQGAGQAPAFLALNPNGKIPVIRDDDTGQIVFESNAILMYLADQAGQLFPAAGAERWRGIQLLFFQAASIGPMFGQRVWFDRYTPEPVPYAITRYHRECDRLGGVLDALLADRTWFLDDYSIVDIAHFGWLSSSVRLGYSLEAYPNVTRWFDRVAARPAVQRAVAGARP
jgi:GST-like protein